VLVVGVGLMFRGIEAQRQEKERIAQASARTPKSVPAAERTETYVTKYGTNRVSRDAANPQLLEKNSGPGLT
jgi:hypothetical protein